MPEIFVIGRLSLARYSLFMRMTNQLRRRYTNSTAVYEIRVGRLAKALEGAQTGGMFRLLGEPYSISILEDGEGLG